MRESSKTQVFALIGFMLMFFGSNGVMAAWGPSSGTQKLNVSLSSSTKSLKIGQKFTASMSLTASDKALGASRLTLGGTLVSKTDNKLYWIKFSPEQKNFAAVKKGATVSLNGSATVPNVPPGNYKLTISGVAWYIISGNTVQMNGAGNYFVIENVQVSK